MKTVVIIGAGFSGAVTAAQFLRNSVTGVRLVLINRSGAMARGLAYGTNSSLHLLNVPAGNMSAYVDEPEHFLRFCQSYDPAHTASSFVPRKLYGEYLTAVLDAAEKQCASGVTLERIICEVNCLRPDGEGAQLELADGQCLKADQVVLAFGNFAPADPCGFARIASEQQFQADPWSSRHSDPIDENAPVLLVGTGLTALDVSLALMQQGHRGPIYMVSRRGLRPLPHRPQRPSHEVSAQLVDDLLRGPAKVLKYVRIVRNAVREAQPQGLDWRDVLAVIRTATPRLWQRLSEVERRRFLRHVQPYWDVHRHRVAPAAYQRFEKAVLAGQVQLLAGRVKNISLVGAEITVDVTLRGGERIQPLKVARVINCTGPNTNLARVNDKLITQMREDGLIQADPLGLGLVVDDRLAVEDCQGNAFTWLHYVGPMLKANYWEATAVPELRQHAKQLASSLIDSLR
ncbi:FAD/NAD(P)-binding protein [Pseudomonas sp. SWRI111]|uniref:FAD/NAD(P)-binding protein n=1 Tax=Pseudomonas sp. SWRI111 TaxID=2745507 RepID=UPI001647B45D|nr:FAD/NAD(P)-binding protein [Pseudomonas sp. SWRI111]MBC3207677.1 FAD/NAD(P)-binding protein [Pseudomonas sp. SWRI111]